MNLKWLIFKLRKYFPNIINIPEGSGSRKWDRKNIPIVHKWLLMSLKYCTINIVGKSCKFSFAQCFFDCHERFLIFWSIFKVATSWTEKRFSFLCAYVCKYLLTIYIHSCLDMAMTKLNDVGGDEPGVDDCKIYFT